MRASIAARSIDILQPGLDVIFCGVNPPPDAASSGLSFASPSNRFWQVVHLADFTDIQLRPEAGHELLRYRCGITAVITRPTKRAAQIPTSEFRRARPSFEAKMRAFRPRIVAFLGKRAISGLLGRADIAWGRQVDAFAGIPTWVLPNPSGLNRSFPLEALVRAYSELHLFATQSLFGDHMCAERDGAAGQGQGF